MSMPSIGNPGDWERAYQGGKTPWDLSEPAPSLLAWLRRNPPPGRVAVIGCGKGSDAIALAEAGFEVTGLDLAPTAIAAARARAAERALAIQFEQADLFDLPPAHQGAYDYVFEHTCFCAIPPERREEYVAAVVGMLKPQGHFVAVFFTHTDPGGPPFATTVEEVRAIFSERFELLELAPTEASIPRRQGEETFGVFTRRRD
jgi:SAM-dependent methyltransferase